MARILMIWLAAASGALALGQESAPVASKDFATLHAQLCKREKWETVPWRTDLYEARAASVKEGKPLFIWAMDGQTLGCT
jgi:hypothetical protein